MLEFIVPKAWGTSEVIGKYPSSVFCFRRISVVV